MRQMAPSGKLAPSLAATAVPRQGPVKELFKTRHRAVGELTLDLRFE